MERSRRWADIFNDDSVVEQHGCGETTTCLLMDNSPSHTGVKICKSPVNWRLASPASKPSRAAGDKPVMGSPPLKANDIGKLSVKELVLAGLPVLRSVKQTRLSLDEYATSLGAFENTRTAWGPATFWGNREESFWGSRRTRCSARYVRNNENEEPVVLPTNSRSHRGCHSTQQVRFGNVPKFPSVEPAKEPPEFIPKAKQQEETTTRQQVIYVPPPPSCPPPADYWFLPHPAFYNPPPYYVPPVKFTPRAQKPKLRKKQPSTIGVRAAAPPAAVLEYRSRQLAIERCSSSYRSVEKAMACMTETEKKEKLPENIESILNGPSPEAPVSCGEYNRMLHVWKKEVHCLASRLEN